MTYQPNDPNNPNSDPFAPYTPQSGTGYTPPASAPQQKKGPNTLLMILLGAAIATLCICGICVAGSGGLLASIVNNPTVQAVLNDPTLKASFGTLSAMGTLPDTVPSDANNEGTIEPGSSESGTLSIFEYDAWDYEGRSGERLTINLDTNEEGLNHLGLYDSEGKALERSQFSNTATERTLTYTLPADGTYTILVGGIEGRYTLTVSSTGR